MREKILLLAVMALMSLALFAPASLAQDDDDDDDGGGAQAPLPASGGPALVVPAAAGLVLVGSGVAGLVALRRRNRRDP